MQSQALERSYFPAIIVMIPTRPSIVADQSQTNEAEAWSHVHAGAACVLAGLVVADDVSATRTGSELRSRHGHGLPTLLVRDLELPG